MTSRRVLIHRCFSSLPLLQPGKEHLLGISNVLHNNCCQVFDINALVGVLLDGQVLSVVFTQQVQYLLIVNLQVGTPDQELLPLLCGINAAENVPNGLRNNPSLVFISVNFQRTHWSHHRVRFTTSSLPIGEHCPIIAFQDRFHQAESALIINLVLVRVLSVD